MSFTGVTPVLIFEVVRRVLNDKCPGKSNSIADELSEARAVSDVRVFRGQGQNLFPNNLCFNNYKLLIYLNFVQRNITGSTANISTVQRKIRDVTYY